MQIIIAVKSKHCIYCVFKTLIILYLQNARKLTETKYPLVWNQDEFVCLLVQFLRQNVLRLLANFCFSDKNKKNDYSEGFGAWQPKNQGTSIVSYFEI